MKLVVPALALTLTGLALAASYHTVAPPDIFLASWPNDTVPLGQFVTMGCSSPLQQHDQYLTAFAFHTNITVQTPNGTILNIGHVESYCNSPLHGEADTFGFHTADANETGTYVARWNQTYGTVSNVSEANATMCDTSRLSNQSWVFSASFTVAQPTPDATTAAVTDAVTTFTLSPAPTGQILARNGAAAAAASLAMVVGAVGVVVLKLL